MADLFQITSPVIRAEGKDVPPEQIQAGFNSLARQTQNALNTVGSDPTGPAGGDLSGSYPNPTVTGSHITSGTMSGVGITTGSINNTPIGATTQSTGAFTTATTGSLFASGGAVPAVTATGTQVYNSPNPTVQFIDSIRSAGNKNAYMQWGATTLALGFANDAFTGFTNVFTMTGGFAAGVSGITSTSGSGAWAHTGGFSATGGINSTAVGAVTPSTGAFTTLSATGAVSGAGFTGLFASPPPVGSTAPNTGAFTTLTASTPVGVASGGSGTNTHTAHGVLIGEGTAAVVTTSAGTTGQMLLGVTGADPAFGNNPTITGGTINGAAVGGTTPAAGAFTTLSASGNDALFYQTTNAQSFTSGVTATVTTWTQVWDRLNTNFNASTGVFTAPATGFYHVDASLTWAGNTGAIFTVGQVTIVANSVAIATGTFYRQTATNDAMQANVSAVVSLAAGQTVTIQGSQNTGGAVALNGANTQNYVAIHRVP